jgi:hypothetical protein
MRKFFIEGYFIGKNELYIDTINLCLKNMT